MANHSLETIADRINYSTETLRKDICALKFLPPSRMNANPITTLDELELLVSELLQSRTDDKQESDIRTVSDIVNNKLKKAMALPGQRIKDPIERQNFRELLNDYQHIEWHYSGRYSVILKAETPSGREVAIKIPRNNNSLCNRLFMSEVQTVSALKPIFPHQNLVEYIEETYEPYPALVMEWLPGVTLEEYWQLNGQYMNFENIVTLILGITKVLRLAHDLSRVHLDIHPQNIIFRGYETNSPPVLLDWGLSAYINSSGVVTSPVYRHKSRPSFAIPFEYAAPEQFDNDFGFCCPKTDVYRLGLIFHDLLSNSDDDPALNRSNHASALAFEFEASNITAPSMFSDMLQASLKQHVKDRCSLDEFGRGLAGIVGTDW